MAMAQVIRNTGVPIGTSTMLATIASLRSTMVTGGSVTATDINALISLYNTWIAHVHSTTDLRGKQTFGNLIVYSASGTYTTTTSSVAGLSTPSTTGAQVPGSATFSPFSPLSLPSVASGATISASDANNIITFINDIITHQHTINDVTS